MPPDGDDQRPAAAKGKAKAASHDAWTSKRPPINAALLLDAAHPRLPTLDLDVAHLTTHQDAQRWTPLAICDSHVPVSTWLSVVELHVEFPERSSTSILRAEVVRDERRDAAPFASTWTLQRTLITRLLPRRARLDAPMLQRCLFYARHSSDTDETRDAMVVYVPLVDAEDDEVASLPSSPDEVPYYFPRVRALCIRYESASSMPPSDAASTSSADSPAILGRCQLDVLLFPSDMDQTSSQPSLNSTSRLSRTALSLLTLQQTHAWGEEHSYVKRVTHDLLVDRALYLDTYSALKWRHAQRLVASWTERTDPAKHAFEDLGIAAFLMTLWKGMFEEVEGGEEGEDAPWKRWGRPKGGFVDVGCGNGLLVHILNAEGYEGFGLDLRARKSWDVWRGLPGGADLRTISVDAPSVVLQALESSSDNDEPLPLPRGAWLIGNHADELTPWIPLLAASTRDCPGFLNLPCCPWKLDGSRYTAKQTALRDDDVAGLLFPGSETLDEGQREVVRETMQSVRRGPQAGVSSSATEKGTTSRTAAYLALISLGHLEAGWKLEKEALRIPSTRNWALVGRRRLWEDDMRSVDEERRKRAEEHEEFVKRRLVGLARRALPSWTARTPEGNAGKDSH